MAEQIVISPKTSCCCGNCIRNVSYKNCRYFGGCVRHSHPMLSPFTGSRVKHPYNAQSCVTSLVTALPDRQTGWDQKHHRFAACKQTRPDSRLLPARYGGQNAVFRSGMVLSDAGSVPLPSRTV